MHMGKLGSRGQGKALARESMRMHMGTVLSQRSIATDMGAWGCNWALYARGGDLGIRRDGNLGMAE